MEGDGTTCLCLAQPSLEKGGPSRAVKGEKFGPRLSQRAPARTAPEPTSNNSGK